MFKKKILIGHSEDTLLAIIEHIEKSNIPCEIGIKGIFERSSEVYDAFYTVKKICETSGSHCCTICVARRLEALV